MDNYLGVILKAQRKRRGMTLLQLGKLSGLHPGHLSHIERGERPARGLALKKLAKPLGFSEIELFKLAGFLSPDEIDPISPSFMLTAREVAVLLKVHINTVRRWGNRGILKAYRLGPRGDRRFRREDIETFISGVEL